MGRNKLINVHSIISVSRVNGPGKRLVVFFQGCARHCPGCFNPGTHPFKEVSLYSADDILKRFLAPGIEGITISGGEPFEQREGLIQLLRIAREEYGLSTVVYTGFSYEELAGSATSQIFNYIDVLIDGAYEDDKKEPSLLARGSSNQRFIFFSDRYQQKDFSMPAKVEIIISRDGTIRETGFSKVELFKAA